MLIAFSPSRFFLDVGVEFEVANYTVPENNGTVTVCVITSTGTAVSFTVGVQAVPKTTSNAATRKPMVTDMFKNKITVNKSTR